jgi:RNA recognition motif-containing protein
VANAHSPVRIEESAGLTRKAEIRSRSLRVKKLPPGTTDGLLQQTFEKLAPVVSVQVTEEKGEAVVELKNPAVRIFILNLAFEETDCVIVGRWTSATSY